MKRELRRDVEDVAELAGVSHVHRQDVWSAADVLKINENARMDVGYKRK